jgi:DNA-binding transcriptional MerR regulator
VAGIRGDGAAPEARKPIGSRAGAQAAEQLQFLFDDAIRPQPEDLGYRGPTACAAAGITYRQLDYWARTGLVEPSVRPASGSGTQRLYGFRDILVLKVVKRLLDAGISLQQIRHAVAYLHGRGGADLAQVTLMCDGASVYEFTSQDEVIDLLQGGQGVFGIALSHVWREVEGSLAALPAERAGADDQDAGDLAADGDAAEAGTPSASQADELARRRARRIG